MAQVTTLAHVDIATRKLKRSVGPDVLTALLGTSPPTLMTMMIRTVSRPTLFSTAS
jgi:hypothetical protein